MSLPKNKLKLLYIDVIRGYSQITNSAFDKRLFIKHFTTFDIGDFDVRYDEYLERAKKEGLPTLEDKEAEILKNGFWSTAKDDQIADIKSYMSRLRLTKSKTFRKKEINQITEKLQEYQKKLDELENEKRDLLSHTAESFARKKINELHIQKAFFKDSSLNLPLFSEDEFDELDDNDIYKLTECYNATVEVISDHNLKRIALSPFFINVFSLVENPTEFYGKPVINLTFYQIELYTHGKYFRSIFSNSKASPPDHLMEDPDKLIEWFERAQNVQENVEIKGENSVTSMVGVSKEDREELGIEATNPHGSLMEAAKKSGGVLSMEAIMGIIGNK